MVSFVNTSQHRIWVGFLAGWLLLCDHLLLVESRLALTDSFLVLFTAISVLGLVHFLQQPVWSKIWWIWVMIASFGAGTAISVKWTALALFPLMGVAAARQMFALLPQYQDSPKSERSEPQKMLRDIVIKESENVESGVRQRKQHRKDQVTTSVTEQHVVSKQHAEKTPQSRRSFSYSGFVVKFLLVAFVMAIIPAIIYLASFWAHFRLLPYHGPGDSYMTAEFRRTLIDNEATNPEPPEPQSI